MLNRLIITIISHSFSFVSGGQARGRGQLSEDHAAVRSLPLGRQRRQQTAGTILYYYTTAEYTNERIRDK
jgi:hypothetical protein